MIEPVRFRPCCRVFMLKHYCKEECMMKVYELAKAVDPYVVSMRRYFHENPELSNQEDKTIERIGQELDAMGIRYEVVPKGDKL